MVNDITVNVKSAADAGSKAAKGNRKTEVQDKIDFGQALQGAADAAGSMVAQGNERLLFFAAASDGKLSVIPGMQELFAVQTVEDILNPEQQAVIPVQTEDMPGKPVMQDVRVQETVLQTQQDVRVQETVPQTEQQKAGGQIHRFTEVPGEQPETEGPGLLTGTGKIQMPEMEEADGGTKAGTEVQADIPPDKNQAASEQQTENLLKSAGTEGMLQSEEDGQKKVTVRTETTAEHVNAGALRGMGVQETIVPKESNVTEAGSLKAEYTEMLKDMVANQVMAGKQEFEISLTPKYLGSLLVKVAYEAGHTSVSIICSDAKTMQAMSQKAEELGRILETNLGSSTEVIVDNGREETQAYADGRNGRQDAKEQQEKRHDRRQEETAAIDFLQQLRLGLA